MNERYSRQSFLGYSAARRFEQCTIAIVGLGGGGSHVAQQIAHLGLRHVRLFDGDTAELSNLNRLIGATSADAENGTRKVDIARRMILNINPIADVQIYECNWQHAAENLRDVDVIVSCVDSYAARQDLEATARRYLIPLIDVGMDVHVVENCPHISGQVILSIPNGPCLKCLGFLNEANLRKEADLYGAAGPRPQVVWPNGVLASVAVGLLANLLSDWGPDLVRGEYLHFDGDANRVWRSPRLEYAECACPHYPADAVGDPFFH